MSRFKAACVQVNATNEFDANLQAAAALACDARAAGADLVLMPENVSMMEWGSRNVVAKAMPEAEHRALSTFRELARESGLWLHCGSLAVLLDNGRVANRTLLLDPRGEVVARYDKIHMFDVDLGNGEAYRESATFEAGAEAVVACTPWGGLGLSICYDLRFPHLYRSLAKAGPISWRCRRPSPVPPGGPIGMCCSGRGPSRPAASSSLRPSAASMWAGGRPMAMR